MKTELPIKLSLSMNAAAMLIHHAATQKKDVAQVASELIENAIPALRPSEIPIDQWTTAFDAWMAEVHGRASAYPSDFVVDDSRESIYEGRGE